MVMTMANGAMRPARDISTRFLRTETVLKHVNESKPEVGSSSISMSGLDKSSCAMETRLY